MTLTVESTGPLASVQDLGRPGFADIGVPEGGAADRHSFRLANRLVGNCEHAAGIEALLGGLVIHTDRPIVAAVTGAPASVTADGRAMPFGEAFHVDGDSRLEIGTPVAGLRTYLAVRGGIAGTPVLGSQSTAPTLELGPAVLRPGTELAIGKAADSPVPQPFPAPNTWGGPTTVRVIIGPRDDWFTAQSLATLMNTSWTVTSDLDRVGVRLDGPALERSRPGELASEGMVRGAIQVPPSGRPVVFLADHPTTGGYPVIAVVTDADSDRIAQLRPGDLLRFTR